jgi:hypothetical protein
VVVPLVGPDEMRRFEAAFRQAAADHGSAPPPDGDAPEGGEDADDDGERYGS